MHAEGFIGLVKKWKQTYRYKQDGSTAGIGYTYLDGVNKFAPPQPFPSWILDEERYLWEPPVPLPDEDKRYGWDEATMSWKEIE